MEDSTWLGAIVLLVIILCFAVFVKITPKQVHGYWSDGEGKVYRIYSDNAGLRASSAGEKSVLAIKWPRRLTSGRLTGTLDFERRHIKWDNGAKWTRQGFD
jgi:hypothetical protein